MTLLTPRSCEACEASLTTACLRPRRLCGLCKLLTREDLDRHLRTWNRSVADLETTRREEAA